MKKNGTKAKFLVGAAIAGLMIGAVAPLASCSGDASAKERNGCNGPNGCGGHGDKKEANGCNGPNGCNGHGNKKEANGCNGPNGCNGQEKKK
ncbi:MAG TPA: hypothetical protein VF384_18385 [Planctomycetota bacterium]